MAAAKPVVGGWDVLAALLSTVADVSFFSGRLFDTEGFPMRFSFGEVSSNFGVFWFQSFSEIAFKPKS